MRIAPGDREGGLGEVQDEIRDHRDRHSEHDRDARAPHVTGGPSSSAAGAERVAGEQPDAESDAAARRIRKIAIDEADARDVHVRHGMPATNSWS